MISENKIKIAHIVPSFDVGGLENGVINLINNMNDDDFEHSIFVFNGEASASSRITKPVSINCLHKRAGNDLKLPLRMSKLLKEFKPDIVRTYAWGSWVEGVIAANIAGVPVKIHSEHGFIINNECATPLRRRVAQYFVSKFTDKIIAVSESIREALIEHSFINADKIITITNGVNSEKFSPQSNPVSNLRNELGIEADDCIMATVSRLDAVKDITTAIRSIREVPKAHLVIIGGGDQEVLLKRTVSDLDLGARVHFLGERSDVNTILPEVDIYALTSLREGTSNTLLEAMSTGLPVVVTNVGGNLLIVKDFENGRLIDVKSHEQLGSILQEYISNKEPFVKMGICAREIILEKYSLINMVAQYEKTYRALIAKKNK